MNTTTFAIRDQKQSSAILLIHGFGGESHATFGMMPAFLAGNPAFYDWDIHCFGYPTALKPDLTGVWSADPDLTTLSSFLSTALVQLTFKRYRQLALIGHSMGGLIIQRALLDGGFLSRVSHVVLFGTPSNGLKKSGLGKLFKRQVRDMQRDGPFITLLRSDWKAQIGNKPPFAFRVVAGLRDEFVPRESSVDVFPPDFRSFINGNHLEIVKPELPSSDSIELLLHAFGRSASPAKAKPRALPRTKGLQARQKTMTEKEREDLAYALEAQGRDAEAITLLENTPDRSLNLTGVLAARLKRRWLADPVIHADAGVRSRELYQEAYEEAGASDNHEQALYNGINYAFMTLALDKDSKKTKTIAANVLQHTLQAPDHPWARPTQGEAYLYLGDLNAAFLAYTETAKQQWTSREWGSIRRQAIWAARLMDSPAAERQLEDIFDSAGSQIA